RHDAAGIAEGDGADYATASPVFPTPGKGAPLGTRGLAALCREAPISLVALGGVGPENAGECLTAGAAAVAAIRAVWEGDPAANVRHLLSACQSHHPRS
ncbi:MAG: thiamine phosphate synthase, partial [Gemmatimonadota bacterium]|nr:thiamine phosphate synthase [Gemmatimonadota bacterium]